MISFYHHAKGFYHEHEVQSQSDGKLIAYYYSKEHIDGHRDYLKVAPILSIKNNEAINWYLDQFERQFIGYAEEISKQHREFTKRIDLRRRSRNALISMSIDANEEIRKCLIEYKCLQNETYQREGDTLPSIISLLNVAQGNVDLMSPEKQKQELKKFTDSKSKTEIKEIKELHARLRVLSKLCGDALTEYTYCKTLLGSKYNDDYKHDRYFSNRQVELLSLSPDSFPNLLMLDNRRKKAFNIRNSIRYIEGVRQNCSRWESELTENLIEHVHYISNNHKKALATIKTLSSKANDLSEENKKMLKASEKSNLYSSLLGWFSMALGVIGIGLALLAIDELCKFVGYCVLVSGVIIAFVGGIKYIIDRNKLPK